MKAYNFNKEDFTFCGVVDCQIDPVRSRKIGEAVFLLPANSTFIEPPIYDVEKSVAVWNGEAWGLVEIVEPEPEEPTLEPTQLDQIEAQVTYTAMMTDTLLEV